MQAVFSGVRDDPLGDPVHGHAPPAAINAIWGLRSTVIYIKEFRGPKVDELIKFTELVSKELGNGHHAS